MIRFHYKLGFLRNCLRLTSAFEFSSPLRDLQFRCGFYLFNDESWSWIISGIFRVNRKLIFHLKLLCNFRWNIMESKFTWHFLFLQLNPSCFKRVLAMSLLQKCKGHLYRPKYTVSFFTLSELKQLTISKK